MTWTRDLHLGHPGKKRIAIFERFSAVDWLSPSFAGNSASFVFNANSSCFGRAYMSGLTIFPKKKPESFYCILAFGSIIPKKLRPFRIIRLVRIFGVRIIEVAMSIKIQTGRNARNHEYTELAIYVCIVSSIISLNINSYRK